MTSASARAFQNLNQNPRTLLPKFFGLYCVQCGGKNIRVVVMNNILPRSVRMHLKFDLKGSTYKRRASKKEREKSKPTFKDLDFLSDVPEGLNLDQDTYGALIKTLQRDCLVRDPEDITDAISTVSVRLSSINNRSSGFLHARSSKASKSWTTVCCWGSTTRARRSGSGSSSLRARPRGAAAGRRRGAPLRGPCTPR